MDEKRALSIIDITKKTYDLIAEDFSDTRNRVWPEMKVLVDKYVKTGGKILDIGCGNGRLVQVLPDDIEYLGIDGSEGLVTEANKIKNNIDFRVLDILELEKLGEDKFNIIFMFAVFNHLPSEKLRLKVLEDIKKLLKPGGLLMMTNWNLWQLGKKKSVWKHGLKRDVITHWQSGDRNRKGDLYYRAFTKQELNKLFKQVGFEILENYYAYQDKKAHWWNGRNIVSVIKQ